MKPTPPACMKLHKIKLYTKIMPFEKAGKFEK
jgi:hypothetical protein